ncbi:hypothetical protein ANCCAN_21905 [Ancylostoma caninum]|uniref:Uncharacterized protein n=1 Tax=Ancylostoma caninum TaxID=29170 RepID=A0A368FJF7_ANCCA|nr:hypothetical protein ANCCAN_21905 [Ancylostoma caninum]
MRIHSLGVFQTWNNRYTNDKSGSGNEGERVLKMAVRDAFLELKGNLEEGAKLYNDLTSILVRLQQKGSGGSDGGSGGGDIYVLPPRPPPRAHLHLLLELRSSHGFHHRERSNACKL